LGALSNVKIFSKFYTQTMQKTHHLYAFLAGLIRALNCYHDIVKDTLAGLAVPVVLLHKIRHENV